MRKELGSIVTVLSLLLFVVPAVSQTSGDSDISVSLDRKCSANAYDFQFTTNVTGQQGYPLIGTGGVGFFTYLPSNNGEMAHVEEDIDIYRYNVSSGSRIEEMDLPNQSFSESYLFNSTNFDGKKGVSRLWDEGNESVLTAPYWYNLAFDNWDEERPESLIKVEEFIANRNFTEGIYEAELKLDYACEFEPDSSSTVYNSSSGEEFIFSGYTPPDSKEEVVDHLMIDGLNATEMEKLEEDYDYVRTRRKHERYLHKFKVVTVEGNGSTPDEVSDINQKIGRNLETDADEVSNFTKNSTLNKDVNESVNSTRNVDVDANQTSDLKKNATLETDANETKNTETNVDTDVDEQVTNSTPVEGSSPEPGETPVPEPDPNPILSLEMRPLQTEYETPKNKFKEIEMEVENVGVDNISNLQIEPRFSEDMNWSSQDAQIESLKTGEVTNISVFVKAGLEVSPSVYQIPVYSSSEEYGDIGNEFVNVEVTEEVSRSVLTIGEAPQSISFEQGKNYSLPILLENSGSEDLNNVEIELEGLEGCGEYSSEEVEEIVQGESEDVSINLTTANAIDECSGTIVASSDSGSYAFSEMEIDVVEDKGVLPKEFRVPIIASLWTTVLLAYTVVTQRRGMDSATVKIPMVILILGEVFILMYLSSAYYSFIPSEILPF